MRSFWVSRRQLLLDTVAQIWHRQFVQAAGELGLQVGDRRIDQSSPRTFGNEVRREPMESKRGTVYVTLGRMEDKRFITSREEAPPADEGGLPRRLYGATPFGRHVYDAWNMAAAHMALRYAR